jgi:hypothetical protein
MNSKIKKSLNPYEKELAKDLVRNLVAIICLDEDNFADAFKLHLNVIKKYISELESSINRVDFKLPEEICQWSQDFHKCLGHGCSPYESFLYNTIHFKTNEHLCFLNSIQHDFEYKGNKPEDINEHYFVDKLLELYEESQISLEYYIAWISYIKFSVIK